MYDTEVNQEYGNTIWITAQAPTVLVIRGLIRLSSRRLAWQYDCFRAGVVAFLSQAGVAAQKAPYPLWPFCGLHEDELQKLARHLNGQ